MTLASPVCRYHNGDAYIIDVSQSVEHDHPHALEFLRKDCSNINGESLQEGSYLKCENECSWCFKYFFCCFKPPLDHWSDNRCQENELCYVHLKSVVSLLDFFVKRGVAAMTVRELFDFITDPSITCNNIDQYLEKVRAQLLKEFVHRF